MADQYFPFQEWRTIDKQKIERIKQIMLETD
jgi:hypothetical protein